MLKSEEAQILQCHNFSTPVNVIDWLAANQAHLLTNAYLEVNQLIGNNCFSPLVTVAILCVYDRCEGSHIRGFGYEILAFLWKGIYLIFFFLKNIWTNFLGVLDIKICPGSWKLVKTNKFLVFCGPVPEIIFFVCLVSYLIAWLNCRVWSNMLSRFNVYTMHELQKSFILLFLSLYIILLFWNAK